MDKGVTHLGLSKAMDFRWFYSSIQPKNCNTLTKDMLGDLTSTLFEYKRQKNYTSKPTTVLLTVRLPLSNPGTKWSSYLVVGVLQSWLSPQLDQT